MPNDLELRDALEQQAAEASGREHPEPEQLVAYHEGAVSREQEKALQEHLVWCRECTALLLGLSDLAEAAGSSDSGDDWTTMRSKLPLPSAPSSAPLPPRLRERERGGRRGLLYSVAASLAAATVALSFWVVDLRHKVTDLSEPQINPVVRDLYLSDAPRSVAGTGFNEVPAEAGLTLILNSSEPRSFPEYLLAVEDASGTEIWRRQGIERSPFDTFTVALPGRFLPPGDYRLRLYGREGAGWTPIEEFPLRVR